MFFQRRFNTVCDHQWQKEMVTSKSGRFYAASIAVMTKIESESSQDYYPIEIFRVCQTSNKDNATSSQKEWSMSKSAYFITNLASLWNMVQKE